MSAILRRAGLRPLWRSAAGEPVVALAALPGGGIAAGGSEGELRVLGADGTPRWADRLDDALLTVSASPDGRRVGAHGMASRRLWDDDGARVASADCGWSATAAWDDRSGALAVGDGRHVRLLDRDGVVRWSSPRLSSTVTAVVWPRGRLRVAAAAYRGVTILEPSTDRVTATLAAPGSISGLAASPSGRWVVGGSQDATLHGWKVDDGSDFRMSGFPTTVSLPTFAGTGRWLACCSGDVVTCWDFSGAGPTGREAAVLNGHGAPVTGLAWAPGDRHLLVSGDEAGTVLLWRLDATVRPGARPQPVGGLRGAAGDPGDPGDAADPGEAVTALTVSGTRTAPVVHVGRRCGRVDTLAPA
ncbi:WD40 repeat domain-containing protein [Pseudonocardia spirodelae]|uniref:WD40 repeat domain-containing protein n=1 Tax=Pseudonocardia spirodelae TaxID=3133431 RepID=A0ABU8T163_9PSEU